MSWTDNVHTRFITEDVLRRGMPGCAQPEIWADAFDDAFHRARITDPAEMAMILAQVGHECRSFSRLEENLGYSKSRLVKLFGRRLEIAGIDPDSLYRADGSPDRRAIANAIYGGKWGKRNLGNTHPNDGWDFRGRGPLQLTGRYNYAAFEHDTARPVVATPSLLLDPEVGAEMVVWYWQRNVEFPAPIAEVTADINGGHHGLSDREKRLDRMHRALEEI